MSTEGTKTAALTDIAEVSYADGCLVRVLEGPDSGLERAMSDRLVIGSGESADLRLSDETVSSEHTRISIGDGGIVVEDLASTNGTRYLATRLQRAVVPLGAILKLGHTRIQIASSQPAASAGLSEKSRYGSVIGATPPMRRLFAALERLESYAYPTLLLGETGVGKEIIAREIHLHSPRKNQVYEICDCTALPPTLAESEFFGHARGAFTGAQSDHKGVFERAHGGTVFLDEIGELPLDLQPKLLRVLESGEIRRIGAQTSTKIDVRILAATNRELADEVAEKRFRQDLLYRLNTVTINVPPLRQRREDIPALVHAFLKADGLEDVALSPQTLELFTTGYDWPGNVRELRNAVARSQAMGSLPEGMTGAASDSNDDESAGLQVDTSAPFQEAKQRLVSSFERDYLSAKLAAADNNISQAARDAGVERTHFKRLLRKHDLLPGTDKD